MRNLFIICLLAIFSLVQAEVITLNILSDTTWKSTNTSYASWATLGFNDSGWSTADNVNGTTTYSGGYYIWEGARTGTTNNEVFFRKIISFTGTVLSASMVWVVDDDMEMYINNTQVYRETNGGAESGSMTINPTYFLSSSQNIIAFHTTDGDLPSPHDQGDQYFAFNITLVVDVPEPSTVLLVGLMLAAYGFFKFRKH